jgi:hypothetical protein
MTKGPCCFKPVSLTSPLALTFAYTKGNRAKCEKHGLSTFVIESLSPARLPFSPTRPIRNVRWAGRVHRVHAPAQRR